MNTGSLIGIILLGISIIFHMLFKKFFYIIKVDGNSMLPTFKNGDWVLVKKSKKYKNGDIIVFKTTFKYAHCEEGNMLLIKRIIGIEKEILELKKDSVYKNEVLMNEPYIIKDLQSNYLSKDKKHIVKENHVFVLGDNRRFSMDSRSESIGQVNKKQIVGKVCWSFSV